MRLMFDLGKLKSNHFDEILKRRMLELNIWLVKVQRVTPGFYLSHNQVGEIKLYIKDAFMYDHNMIIEEFPFY